MKKKETTKQKILSAAQNLFVSHGFAGTSIGNIAKLAEVNHSLIFHHFKNKQQLWVAVKQNIVSEASSAKEVLPDEQLPFECFLTELFFRNIAFYRENPDIIRMLSWQRLEAENNHDIGVTQSSSMSQWMKTFEHFQQQGDIPELKPEWIVTMILSIISSAALDPNEFLKAEKDMKDYIDFCVQRLLLALKAN